MNVRLTPKLVFIVTGILIVLLVTVGYIILPFTVRFIQNGIIELVPGHFIRDRHMKFPFRILFRMYLFNVTNAEQVMMDGAKPILQEVGPYVFEEEKEKVDGVDDVVNDTLEFVFRNRITLNPEMTAPLTGQETLVLPYYEFLLTLLYGAKDVPLQLDLIMEGIDIVLNKPNSMFKTYTADEVLWKGIDIDCTSTAFPAKVICSNMGGRPQFEKQDNRHLLFKWGNIRNTTAGKFKVKRGRKNIQDVEKVVEFKEMTKHRVWNGEECNRFEGTDGLLFAPEMKKGAVPKVFVYDACRTLSLYPTKEKGWYRTLKYVRHVGRFTNVYDNGTQIPCWCRKYPEDCPYEGTWDISPCVAAPIAVSKPHLLDVDPAIAAKVEGLAPSREDHELWVNFNYFVGVPVQSKVRVQLNMILHPVPEHEVAKNFPNLLLPLLWFEENINVTGDTLGVTKLSERCRLGYLIYRKVMMVLIIFSVGFGFYLKHINSATVTPIKSNQKQHQRDVEKPESIQIVEEIVNDIKIETLSRID